MEYKKKFIIIANKGAVGYKEVFPYIQKNQIWPGHRNWAGGMWFITANEDDVDKVIDGQNMKNVPAIWLTNLDIAKRHEEIILYKHYNPAEYPKYDNYDAIDVKKVADIPCDYDGPMGVPITFLDKYNPEQFEILGRSGDIDYAEKKCDFYTPPRPELADKYKKQNKTWRIQNVYTLDNTGVPQIQYSRLFIRKIK